MGVLLYLIPFCLRHYLRFIHPRVVNSLVVWHSLWSSIFQGRLRFSRSFFVSTVMVIFLASHRTQWWQRWLVVVQALVYTRTAIDKDQMSRHSSLNGRFTGLDMSSTKNRTLILSKGYFFPGDTPLYKWRGCSSENFENTPKRYQNLVLWACTKFISTPKRYQFNNNKLYM